MRKPAKAPPRSRRSGPASKAADAYHHGDLRQALIDEAWRQVDREGPDSLSLSQLAKSLGVSQPAPYRHFPDRGALLAALATRGFQEFTASLKAAAHAAPKGAALSRMAQAYVEFGTRRRGVYRLMFASPILIEASDAALKVVARGSFELLIATLETPVDAARRQQRALRIWVGLHGIVMLANQGLLQDGVAAARLPELVESLLAG